MKPFAKYLAESERTYDYRIKMCGRIPDGLVRELKQKLNQFDPAKLGDAKTTPIQKILTDFPNNQNDAVPNTTKLPVNVNPTNVGESVVCNPKSIVDPATPLFVKSASP